MTLLLGERKDFEVYSCDVSPDGKRLVTAAGGESCHYHCIILVLQVANSWTLDRWLRSHLVYGSHLQYWESRICQQTETACLDE